MVRIPSLPRWLRLTRMQGAARKILPIVGVSNLIRYCSDWLLDWIEYSSPIVSVSLIR